MPGCLCLSRARTMGRCHPPSPEHFRVYNEFSMFKLARGVCIVAGSSPSSPFPIQLPANPLGEKQRTVSPGLGPLPPTWKTQNQHLAPDCSNWDGRRSVISPPPMPSLNLLKIAEIKFERPYIKPDVRFGGNCHGGEWQKLG